jgi:serine/threonine protein kinase
LNHPHIAALHGLEESNGVRALVLELVEGDTLADHIARGPIPVDEALSIAKQIADALEAAHDQGIIHRDLKPANIKITPDAGWHTSRGNPGARKSMFVRFQDRAASGKFPQVAASIPPGLARDMNCSSRIRTIGSWLQPSTSAGESFQAAKPSLWSDTPFEGRPGQRDFDLHPDGSRFALGVAVNAQAFRRDEVLFVFNFFDELRRLAPAK